MTTAAFTGCAIIARGAYRTGTLRACYGTVISSPRRHVVSSSTFVPRCPGSIALPWSQLANVKHPGDHNRRTTERRADRSPTRKSSSFTMTVAESKSTTAEPQPILLTDYTRPQFLVDNVHLTFELDDEGLDTTVRARLDVRRAPDAPADASLELDGELLELVSGSLALNGSEVATDDYEVSSEKLTIKPSALPPGTESFVFESAVKVKPAKNKALEGLYMSSGNYCTQCEAESFRRITYFPDRPDVMSKYLVRIEASKTLFPVLLSNGNMIETGDVVDQPGKHYAVYEDPWAKPAYLFALVAGQLSYLEDYFTTRSGKDVRLRIYVKGDDDVPKCRHAMDSLKRALKWEEDVYGLEYDLSIFNVVAVPDFSMGAMENKSLNIFNSKYILCSPETATDSDFNGVEGVVAHELFHNFSGNRVTLCRWFELTLKEGLTVFRDQSFSADMNSAAVKRISDVTSLRAGQFAEDAGPLAHPIRPTSYITPSTFYTSTVYSKGAEVIRMLHTLVGPEGYRRGTDLYFSRHDGQAVTCEDFLNCIQETNPDVDLSTFPRWYAQAGTPVVTISTSHAAETNTLSITASQEIPPTAKQPHTEPSLIPIRTGVIGPDGAPVLVDDGDGDPSETKVLMLREKTQTFSLKNVPAGSIPSLFRGFSAPIKVVREGGVNRDELAFMMANDPDSFNRWESGQTLALETLLDYVRFEGSSSDFPDVPDSVISAFGKALVDETVDPALRAELFSLPLESYIIEQLDVADPVRIREARKHVRKQLGAALKDSFQSVFEKTSAALGTEYKLDPASKGNRALKNIALSYLATSGESEVMKSCLDQVRSGSNMTDVLAALSILAGHAVQERDLALKEFFDKWEKQQLVVQKWLRTQATSPADGTLDVVRSLLDHPSFDITVPNDVYALIGGFAYGNMHFYGDEAYTFVSDQVLKLDKINPQVAARIARVFNRWRKFDADRQAAMKTEFDRILAQDGLSKDVFEVIQSCIKG